MVQSLLIIILSGVISLHAHTPPVLAILEDFQTIGHLAPDGTPHHIKLLCQALHNNEQPSSFIIEAAFEEAVACLEQGKDTLPQEEVERLANNLETSYASFMQESTTGNSFITRGTKKIDNLIVRNQASVGSLFVGGDEIVNHNLTVNNDLHVRGNEIVDGNLTVRGNLVFSDTHVVMSGDQTINGNLTVTGNTSLGTCGSTNTISGITIINTSCSTPTTIGNVSSITTIIGPTNINTTGSSTTNIGSLGTGRVNIGNVTGNTIFTGSVGIGTATPITQLNIVQNSPFAVGSINTVDVPYGVYIQGRYAYVITYNNNLHIYDVSNVGSPTLISTLAIGLSNAAKIYVQGRYAYIVNGNNALEIIDVSNPAAPAVSSIISTEDFPFSVYVQGRYAYVVTLGSLQIFDIDNPTNPVLQNTFGVGLINFDIYVQGRYAYIVDNGNNNLIVVDVSNPSAPSVVGSAPTDPGPVALYVQGRYAYTTSQDSFQIFDISNPANPTLVSTYTETAHGFNSVFVQGRYAYVTQQGTSVLELFDVSNPASPFSVGIVPTNGAPVELFVQGRYAYIINSTPNNLQIFDLGGAYIQQMEAGGIEVGTLATRENLTVNNDLDVKGGATIGRTLEISGDIGIYGTLHLSNQGALANRSIAQFDCVVASTGNVPVITNLATGNTGNPLQYETSTGRIFQQGSSKKFKHNFRAIDAFSPALYQLKPIIYDMKAEHGGTQNQLGFIAEDVAEILPSLVIRDKHGEVHSIRYDNLHALAIKEIQKHQQYLDNLDFVLQQNLNKQIEVNEKLYAKIAMLEAALEKLK